MSFAGKQGQCAISLPITMCGLLCDCVFWLVVWLLITLCGLLCNRVVWLIVRSCCVACCVTADRVVWPVWSCYVAYYAILLCGLLCDCWLRCMTCVIVLCGLLCDLVVWVVMWLLIASCGLTFKVWRWHTVVDISCCLLKKKKHVAPIWMNQLRPSVCANW